MADLPLSAARRIAEAAERKAADLGKKVSIAIVDGGGHPVLVYRMDDRWFQIEIAQAKAYSAVALRRDTRSLGDRLGTTPFWSTVPHLLSGKVAVGGGGVLIRDGDHVVGAIGVSGAADEDDETIARAGAAAHQPDGIGDS